MITIDQTIFEDGKGNCLAACVASVLELPIDEVPNFAEMGFFEGLYRWLEGRNLRPITVRFSEAKHCASAFFEYSDEPLIMWGDSPRFANGGHRKMHAVVGAPDGYGLKLIHDPHPSREGLHGHPTGCMWIVKK